MDQPTYESLEIICKVRHLVVSLLINMYDFWFPCRATLSIVQANHVVTSRGAIAYIDANGRIAPFLDPKVVADRVSLVFINSKEPGNRYMIFGASGSRMLTCSLVFAPF